MSGTGTTDDRGDDYDVTESDQDTAGDMGVSSEREGATGPGQHGTDGQLDTSPGPAAEEDGELPDAPIPPVAGYNSRDPRSEEKPYEPGPSYER